jgi:hypothetical protein
MKQIKFTLCIIVLFSNCFSHAEKYEIWGVWNIGPEELAVIPHGEFVRTWDYLFFNLDYYGNGSQISYDGGYYKIKKIITQNNNEISFYLEHTQTIIDKKGELVTGTVFGKLIMHFIDKDHMWLELDYNDKNYPTNDQFSDGDFQGANVIFWRARSASGGHACVQRLGDRYYDIKCKERLVS